MTLETALLGKDVEYRAYLCDGGAPWLGSMSFLYESDATINFGLAWPISGTWTLITMFF